MSRSPYSPPRLSTTSRTPGKMSLTEITKPTAAEPYLHNQRLSYVMEDGGKSNQLNPSNATSHVLPPLISLQSRDNTYHWSLNTGPHPLQFSQENPTAPLSHIFCQDHQPSRLMPLHSSSSQFSAGSGAQAASENNTTVQFTPRRQVKKIGQRRDIVGSYRQIDPPLPHQPSRPYEQQRSPQVVYRKTSPDAATPQCTFPSTPGSENIQSLKAPILEARPISHNFSGATVRSEAPRPIGGPAQEAHASQHSYSGVASDNTDIIERPTQGVQTTQPSFSGLILRSQDSGTTEKPAHNTLALQHSFPRTRNKGARSMEISGIIGDTKSIIEPSHEPKYVISLRQQPLAARACGFGDRDRRAVDPPPILQMTIEDPHASPQEIRARLRYPFSVVHCELWNADEDHEETAMPEVNDRPHQRRLMGSVVSSPFVGQDENDVEGCFFCFPDLSCRTSGSYRLRFALLILDPGNLKPGDKSSFRSIAMSQVFRVFAAKDFPGMQESTPLTKALKAQGCPISVKKGNHRTKSSHAREENEDGDEGDEGEEGESPANSRKRQKR